MNKNSYPCGITGNSNFLQVLHKPTPGQRSSNAVFCNAVFHPVLPAFPSVDAEGKWTGLDVDICRAVAAATLGDADKVEFMPLAENESFTALLSGEVDLLSRHSTWTFTRETALGVHFAGISYYDGQGFLISKKLNVDRVYDLKDVQVCSPVDSDFELNLINYFERNNIKYRIVPFDTLDFSGKGF